MKPKSLTIFFLFFFSLVICSGLLGAVFHNEVAAFLSLYAPSKHKFEVSQEEDATSPIQDNLETFYGVSVDMSQVMPFSKYYVRNERGEDLIDIAHKLGINLFRLTSVNKSFEGKKGSVYTKKQWDLVLNKMNANGIKAVILIESPDLSPRDYSNNYLTFVKEYIIDSNVGQDSNVFAIDLHNEPLLNDATLSILSKAAKMIREKYPGMKITVGGWKTEKPIQSTNSQDPYIWQDGKAAPKLNSLVDFYSLHFYGYDKSILGEYPDAYNLTKLQLQKVAPYLNDKPVLIEEFGASNGERITDQGTLGNTELQARVYEGVYQAIKDNRTREHLIGSVAYTFYPRDFNTNGWNLIDNRGKTIYPAAFVLQRYATGKSDQPIDLFNKTTIKSYLVANDSNGKQIILRPNELIGLRIDLNSTPKNYLVVSNPLVLSQTEPLTKENDSEKFDAVFRAVKTGEATISLVKRTTQGVITKFRVYVVVKDS